MNNINLKRIIFPESFDLDLTAIPSDEVDESTHDNNEFETDELKTTSSVVLDDSDSSEVDHDDTDTETDEDSETLDDEDFEFIEHDEL